MAWLAWAPALGIFKFADKENLFLFFSVYMEFCFFYGPFFFLVSPVKLRSALSGVNTECRRVEVRFLLRTRSCNRHLWAVALEVEGDVTTAMQ